MRNSRRRGGASRQRGYVLLAILLMLTLLAIAAATAAPDIAMQIRRERETELINRGTQYMRAIQHYYKKFGRYPVRIEDLENTSNMRFLRKRYKDPITGKDFRLLHYGEVQMSAITGAAGLGAGGISSAAAAAMSGAFGQQTGAFGQGQAPNSGMFSQGPGGPAGPMMSPGGFQTQGQSSGTDPLAGKAFGGGPIIGVASTSHAASIREFNKKNHYNDWYFIYDPTLDRGGLIRGPARPPLAGTGGSVVGQPGMGNQGMGGMGPGGIGPGGMGPGGMNQNSPFGGGPLQGPGAMIPAQPQGSPQQQ